MGNITKNPVMLVPHGLVVTRQWLQGQEIERHRIDNWVKSAQIISLKNGVYKRPDGKLTWQGVVCSLQRMGHRLYPGGVTALQLHGMGHYLPLSAQKIIHLYGVDKLPKWSNRLLPDVMFVYHNECRLFGKKYLPNQVVDEKSTNIKQSVEENFTNILNWGVDDWKFKVSCSERALFEVLMDVPDKISFEYADQLMQGMATLSPRRLNKLLKCYENIKVRRLFLWFAERHNHPWFSKLDLEHFNMVNNTLGAGKRVLQHGGKLDMKYFITVPLEMFKLRVIDGQK